MEGVLSADHLTTIAEVAIALAGFSALIVLLSGRSGRADPRADVLRLRIMLETSLLVVAFALFPFIPSTLGLAPDVWPASDHSRARQLAFRSRAGNHMGCAPEAGCT